MMTKYKCHKEVEAQKIVDMHNISQNPERDYDIKLDDESVVTVTWGWMQKHVPHIGGYYVVYADGYTSFSPAEAFEEGYTEVE